MNYEKGLCAPSIIAGVLGALGVLSTLLSKSTDKVRMALSQLIGGAALFAITFALCYYGYDTAAWVVLLLPLALMVISVLIIMELV